MKKAILVTLAVILSLALCSCTGESITREDLDAAWQSGYEAGYDEGLVIGGTESKSSFDEEAVYSLSSELEEIAYIFESYLENTGEYYWEDASNAVENLRSIIYSIR